MTEEQYELLNKFPKDKSYLNEQQLSDMYGDYHDYNELSDAYNELDKFKFIDGGIPKPGLRINDKGLQGLLRYEDEKAKQQEIDHLNLKKLRFDVKNSERIFNTYWWTFGFALAALLISIFLLILKLAELAK